MVFLLSIKVLPDLVPSPDHTLRHVDLVNLEADLSDLAALSTEGMRHSTISMEGKTISDLGALAGKTIRLQLRMRGSSLYAMQFVE